MRCLPAQKKRPESAVGYHDGAPWLVSHNVCCVRLGAGSVAITHPHVPIGLLEEMRAKVSPVAVKAYPMCPIVRIGERVIQRSYYDTIAGLWPDATWGASDDKMAPVIAWCGDKLVGSVAPVWDPTTPEDDEDMRRVLDHEGRRRLRMSARARKVGSFLRRRAAN